MKAVIKIALIISVVTFASCNITRNIPPGDALYTGATVKIKGNDITSKMKKALQEDLSKLTRPRPNSRILGIPFKLMFYNMTDKPNKKGFIRNILKKWSEPPVLLSDVNLEYNSKVLQNYLENRGYFHATVTGDTTVKRKRAHATYTAQTGSLYTIKSLTFLYDTTSVLDMAIKRTEKKTLIKTGVPFNLDLIKAERERIDAALKEEGFYFFSPNDILIDADSTIGNNMVNLYVTLKGSTPYSARKQYLINEIYIYPNYNLSTAAVDTNAANMQFYKGYYVVQEKKVFKPQLFEHIMQFKPNDVYSRKQHDLALNRLINLGVYKFVKNRFEVDPYTDELNTYYYLTPLPKKTFRAEITGSTKSNNDVGSLVTVSWRNKNAFRGAELLAMNAYVGSDVQYSAGLQGVNTYRTGAEISLTTPKFIIPFFVFNTSGAYVPKSYARIGYDILNRRKLYTLNSFRTDLGYTWKPTERKEYSYNPISINYVQPLNVTPYYDSVAKRDISLRKAIEKQFIIGSNATYTYNEIINTPKGKGWYITTNIDLSGNTVGLFTHPDLKRGDTIKFFNAPYAQYAKTEADVRHYSKLGTGGIWANRIDIGYGYPYGNSYELPYVKQFFIGGNNSLRGFRSRSVGPGTYRPANADSTNYYADESGDIKLEMNTELRQKITGILEGALFIDAGNIWLKNKNPLKPGAEFTGNFLSQLAIDAGIGFRFDLQILLLRFDIATPLRKPWITSGQPQKISAKNLVFNLGIGYPF